MGAASTIGDVVGGTDAGVDDVGTDAEGGESLLDFDEDLPDISDLGGDDPDATDEGGDAVEEEEEEDDGGGIIPDVPDLPDPINP